MVEAGVRSSALITAEFALEQGRTVFAVPGRPGDATAAGALELLREGAAMVVGSDDVLEELGWVRTMSAAAVPPLTGSQRKTLDLVRRSQPATFDGLLEGSGIPAPELLALLGTLELIGVVYRSGSGRWQTSETGTTGGSTRQTWSRTNGTLWRARRATHRPRRCASPNASGVGRDDVKGVPNS